MKTLISIVVIVGLAAVIGAVVVGVRSFDGTVIAKPYEEGLAWDEARKDRAELGWSIKLNAGIFKVGENDLQFTLLDKQGSPLDLPAEVSLNFSRPSTDAYDRKVDVQKLGAGLYRALVNFPLYGQWDIKIYLIKNAKKIEFKERVFVGKG
ncbi:MAG: FixH family protein [Nitrospirae bacterium]|nr:FixH family protein [Nitrospirota bacterium]